MHSTHQGHQRGTEQNMSTTATRIHAQAKEYAEAVTAIVRAVATEYGLPCDCNYVTMAQIAEVAKAAGVNPGSWFPTPATVLELVG